MVLIIIYCFQNKDGTYLSYKEELLVSVSSRVNTFNSIQSQLLELKASEQKQTKLLKLPCLVNNKINKQITLCEQKQGYNTFKYTHEFN